MSRYPPLVARSSAVRNTPHRFVAHFAVEDESATDGLVRLRSFHAGVEVTLLDDLLPVPAVRDHHAGGNCTWLCHQRAPCAVRAHRDHGLSVWAIVRVVPYSLRRSRKPAARLKVRSKHMLGGCDAMPNPTKKAPKRRNATYHLRSPRGHRAANEPPNRPRRGKRAGSPQSAPQTAPDSQMPAKPGVSRPRNPRKAVKETPNPRTSGKKSLLIIWIISKEGRMGHKSTGDLHPLLADRLDGHFRRSISSRCRSNCRRTTAFGLPRVFHRESYRRRERSASASISTARPTSRSKRPAAWAAAKPTDC